MKKNFRKNLEFIFVISLLLFAFPSCSSDDNSDPDSNENFNAEFCDVEIDTDCDGLANVCDTFPEDAKDQTILEDCDADQDDYVDIGCANFDANEDGLVKPDELSDRFFCDNCIGISNPDQQDHDYDLFGDACDNVDCIDNDGDYICDITDNCQGLYNPDQTQDFDADGFGDVCDDDIDGDLILNDSDNCDMTNNPYQKDSDQDDIGDACDEDIDGDGFNNSEDRCPGRGESEQYESEWGNTDKNTWDGCEYDTDGDGIGDHEEISAKCVTKVNRVGDAECPL